MLSPELEESAKKGAADAVGPKSVTDKIMAEAEKRRGRGPWRDSAQHCWAACYISARFTVSVGNVAAVLADIGEVSAPSSDSAKDVAAQHVGAYCPLANIMAFAIFPETMCDCCCLSF